MKKIFVFSLCLFISILTLAQVRVKIGDLYYILSGTEASVTYNRSNKYEYSYFDTHYYRSLYDNQEYTIPSSVSYNGNDYSVTKIEEGAFAAVSHYGSYTDFYYGYYYGDLAYDKESIKKISLSNSIPVVEKAAFYGQHGLSCIEMPDVQMIGQDALSHCTSLTTVYMPNVKEIGSGAFASCQSLVSIRIPETATVFGGNLFEGCSLLREIWYLSTTPPTNWTATTITYVPDITAYSSPSYSMNQANIIEMISFDTNTFIYTGQPPTTTWTNNVEGYTASLNMPILKTDVGEHKEIIPVTYTKEGESFTVNVVYRYSIIPANLTVKTANLSREYGEENPNFTLSYSGFINGENENVIETLPTIATTATEISDVGEYPITISGGSAKNYTLVYEPGTLTITKAPLTAKVDDTTKQYGTGNPAFTVSYNGLKNGETVPKWSEALRFETSATTQSDVGNYAITATGRPVNYNLPSITSGTLSITPAPLKIKANDVTRLYYESNPDFSYSCSGFVNNDNVQVITKSPIFNTDATTKSDVGRYEIIPSGAQAKNYDITYEPGVLTINKRSLTATANSISREYGEENPVLTIAYAGFVNNENESVLSERPLASTSATKNSNVGTYTINLSGGASTNYDLKLNTGILTINKAPLSVIANDATREYGDNNPTFTLRYEGLKLGETNPKLEKQISVVTTANIASPVGEYLITASDGVATNYQLSYNAGKLSITPASLTVTAFSKFRKYGEDNPEFDYSTSSTKLSSDKFTKLPSLICPATKSSPVGTYDITVSGAVMPNYEISYVAGILTIDKGKLEISAKSYSRLYGEDNPVFEVEYSGFANNEAEINLSVKPTITCRATKESNAGLYPILVSGAKADNYEITYNDGMLTITPCKLVISTKDYTRRYGEENPEFEIAYSGFVNGENESNLLKKPDIKCMANATTDVGEYPITLSGAESDNYSFEYNNGKLTITIAEQEIIWEQDFDNIQVGDQIELLAYATSGLPIDYTLSNNNLASIYYANGKAYLDCQDKGTFVIRALQDGNNNYYAAVRKSKTINVVDPTAIHSISKSSVKIQATLNGIRIIDGNIGDIIRIYNIDGILYKAVKVEDKIIDIPLTKHDVYIIKVGGKTVKLSR